MLKSVYLLSPDYIRSLPNTPVKPVSCVLIQEEGRASLFVEAPNWANAMSVGPRLALDAWQQFLQTQQDLPEPCSKNFHFVLVRPGFPENSPLWEESFTQYRKCRRSPTWLYEMRPIAGSTDMEMGAPHTMPVQFERLGLPISSLHQFDETGALV